MYRKLTMENLCRIDFVSITEKDLLCAIAVNYLLKLTLYNFLAQVSSILIACRCLLDLLKSLADLIVT